LTKIGGDARLLGWNDVLRLSLSAIGVSAMPRSSASITRFPGLRLGQTNDNNSPPFNWRRGLWRLWVLASSAWVLGWSVYLTIWALREGFSHSGDLLAIPVLLFGPPIALMIFGLATNWAFRGFLPDKPAAED